MGKRTFSLLLTIGLISSAFTVVGTPAGATEVPATVQIDDPKGDANFLNDQDNAYGTPLAGQGDHVTPADVSSATDLMKVWFSNTETEVSLHFQTEVAPTNLAGDFYFRFSSNPGEGKVANDTTRGCLQYTLSLNGTAGAWVGPDVAELTDKCNVGTPTAGKFVIEELGDGTGVTTLTFPRSASPLFIAGGKITTPFGVSRYLNVGPTGAPAPVPPQATAATADTTKRGTDYALVDGGTNPPPKKKKKGKGPPITPPGCDKGKGKKTGCPQPPKGGVCAPYVPGEQVKDAPITLVTDAATADKPVEVTVATDIGIPEADITHAFHNVQVDSSGAETGLYARFEFDLGQDYDLYLRDAGGTEVARSAGANQAPVGPFDGTGNGGHAEADAEQLDGIKSADCTGYTVDIASYFTEGGDYTLKLWLGEATYPAAPEAQLYRAVMAIF